MVKNQKFRYAKVALPQIVWDAVRVNRINIPMMDLCVAVQMNVFHRWNN
jgi:hypothetical protein